MTNHTGGPKVKHRATVANLANVCFPYASLDRVRPKATRIG